MLSLNVEFVKINISRSRKIELRSSDKEAKSNIVRFSGTKIHLFIFFSIILTQSQIRVFSTLRVIYMNINCKRNLLYFVWLLQLFVTLDLLHLNMTWEGCRRFSPSRRPGTIGVLLDGCSSGTRVTYRSQMKVSVCAVLLGFSCGVVLLLLSARQVLLGVLNC